MNQVKVNNITSSNTEAQLKPESEIVDYKASLELFNISFTEVDYYYQHGTITGTQGWLLHVSCVRPQLLELLTVLLPIVIEHNCPFKLLKNAEVARMFLDGFIGPYQNGKILTLYPPSDGEANLIAEALVNASKSFQGPKILTDASLGGCVYTRYGAFNPIVTKDGQGQMHRCIRNVSGSLIPDLYVIPYVLPEGVTWPFKFKVFEGVNLGSKVIETKYKIIKPLKEAIRGDVTLAFSKKSLFTPQKYVVKQGRENMSYDNYGRDMSSRLAWQVEIYEKIKGKVPTPDIIEFFQENRDSYLVMEYIKGPTLVEYATDQNPNCKGWKDLAVNVKQKILKKLKEFIEIADLLHECGVVHRDFTPDNVICREKLYVIDNELAYSITSRKPAPPFGYGTIGFMNDGQLLGNTPTIDEDLFAIGASIVNILTGLHPVIFEKHRKSQLREALLFLIGDNDTSSLLADCLSCKDKSLPPLETFKTAISDLESKSLHSSNSPAPSFYGKDLYRLISGAIDGLVMSPTIIKDDLWYTIKRTAVNIDGSGKNVLVVYPEFYNGLAGILYVLAKAAKAGFDISNCTMNIQVSSEYLREYCMKKIDNANPGLYFGTAGIAVALCAMIDAGILAETEQCRNQIRNCFGPLPADYTIANGLPGIIIAINQCKGYLDDSFVQGFMDQIGYHLQEQLILVDNRIGAEGGKMLTQKLSLSFGYIGLGFCLLDKSGNGEGTKGQKHYLDNMYKACGRLKKLLIEAGIRNAFQKEKIFDSIQGAVLFLTKYYKVSKDEKYKNLAEAILYTLPKELVHNDFKQGAGLSALGELYLEAYDVYQNLEWMDRANFIANFLSKVAWTNEQGGTFWNSSSATQQFADFGNGNTGIVHFLLRMNASDKIGHLFSI